jgi:hypothetical protein
MRYRFGNDTDAVIEDSFSIEGGCDMRRFGHDANISNSSWIVKELKSVHGRGHSREVIA